MNYYCEGHPLNKFKLKDLDQLVRDNLKSVYQYSFKERSRQE